MLLYKWPREAHYLEGQDGKQGRGRAEKGHDRSKAGAKQGRQQQRRGGGDPSQAKPRREGGREGGGGRAADERAGGRPAADGRADGGRTADGGRREAEGGRADGRKAGAQGHDQCPTSKGQGWGARSPQRVPRSPQHECATLRPRYRTPRGETPTQGERPRSTSTATAGSNPNLEPHNGT